MAVIALRTVLIYGIIIFAMRMMGKKQLGELQPSELVSTILISNLASIPIESPEIPLLSSLLPVLLIVCVEIFLSALCARHHRLATLVSGKPKIVIQHGKLDHNTLKELRFTLDDLMEALRGKDVFDLKDVSFALVETNGTVSVYKTPAATEVTREDLLLPQKGPDTPSMPVLLSGKICHENLAACGFSESWVIQKLSEKRVCAADVALMLCDSDGQYSIYKKGGAVL